MKKITLIAAFGIALLISACAKTYDCTCIESVNSVAVDTFTHTGDGFDKMDVCDAANSHTIVGTDTTDIDCDPK